MDSIYTEVRKFVQDRIDRGVITRVDWLTTEYIAAKSRVEGDDLPFYKACAIAHVNDVVKRVVGRFDPKRSKVDHQLIFPGFTHMQKAYTVQRDGAHLLVPVAHLTDDEIMARAAEFDTMAAGCRDHARELREFRTTRAAVGRAA
jgi:hypothetical protein